METSCRLRVADHLLRHNLQHTPALEKNHLALI